MKQPRLKKYSTKAFFHEIYFNDQFVPIENQTKTTIASDSAELFIGFIKCF